jgi:hypothetical protein
VKVLVPYVNLHPELVKALDGIPAAFVDTSGPTAYWETLAAAWDAGQTFIVVEQDKIPEPGLLEELWECPHVWCSVATAMRDSDQPASYPSLSCTKFSSTLMAAYPTLLEDVGRLDLGLGEKEWSRLDMGIAGLLGRTEIPHWHEGVVEHKHEVAA